MDNKEINELYAFFNKTAIQRFNWDSQLKKTYLINKRRLSQLLTEKKLVEAKNV